MLLLKTRRLSGAIHGLAFSPDGSRLASAGKKGNVLLHDLAAGSARLVDTQSRPFQVALAPDGGALAFAFEHGVGLHPLPEGTPLYLAGSGGTSSDAFQVRFSPNARWLAANAGGLRLWEMPAAEGAERFTRPADWLQSLAFSPDSRLLALGCHDRGRRLQHFIKVVEVPDGKERLAIRGLRSYVVSLAFSPNGLALAAGCGSSVRVWSMPDGKELLHASHGRHYIQAVAFTPDGRFLASGHGDGLVRFWPTDDWRAGPSFDWGIGALNSLAFAPDGMRAAAGSTGKIVLWDVDL